MTVTRTVNTTLDVLFSSLSKDANDIGRNLIGNGDYKELSALCENLIVNVPGTFAVIDGKKVLWKCLASEFEITSVEIEPMAFSPDKIARLLKSRLSDAVRKIVQGLQEEAVASGATKILSVQSDLLCCPCDYDIADRKFCAMVDCYYAMA